MEGGTTASYFLIFNAFFSRFKNPSSAESSKNKVARPIQRFDHKNLNLMSQDTVPIKKIQFIFISVADPGPNYLAASEFVMRTRQDLDIRNGIIFKTDPNYYHDS